MIFVFALVVFALSPLLLLFFATEESQERSAGRSAALRTLRQKGILRVYTSIGSPEEQIQAEERRIVELRKWVETITDRTDRANLLEWLDYAERACGESRKARLHSEAIDKEIKRMASL